MSGDYDKTSDSRIFTGLIPAKVVEVVSYTLGKVSAEKLADAHHDLQKVVNTAIELTDIDFSVIETIRTEEQQALNVKNKVSWTMDSDHLPNRLGEVKAVDIYPWVNGRTSHEPEHYKRVARAMFRSAMHHKVQIKWGGFWKGDNEDQPHWAML